MKKIMFLNLLIVVTFGCNDKGPSTTGKPTSDTTIASTTSEKIDYPYQLEEPYQDWQPGDQKHAVNVMKSLKAYENGDINTCVQGFADTVDIRFDGYRARLSNDSIKKMFAKSRGEIASMKVKMDDWESVISRDKKMEYVTLWYREFQTDKKGKTDSLSIIDDLKIVNGKIAMLDQKIQHFPAVMKK